MYNAVVVEVSNGGEGGADEISSVGLVVAALAADTVEELTAEREVGYEVYYTTSDSELALARVAEWERVQDCVEIRHTVVNSLEVVDESQYILMSHRHPFEDRNLISDLSSDLN